MNTKQTYKKVVCIKILTNALVAAYFWKHNQENLRVFLQVTSIVLIITQKTYLRF